jgi:hypothetical protein
VENGAPIAAQLNESKLRDDESPDPQQRRAQILDWVKQSDNAAADFDTVEVRGVASRSLVAHPMLCAIHHDTHITRIIVSLPLHSNHALTHVRVMCHSPRCRWSCPSHRRGRGRRTRLTRSGLLGPRGPRGIRTISAAAESIRRPTQMTPRLARASRLRSPTAATIPGQVPPPPSHSPSMRSLPGFVTPR